MKSLFIMFALTSMSFFQSYAQDCKCECEHNKTETMYRAMQNGDFEKFQRLLLDPAVDVNKRIAFGIYYKTPFSLALNKDDHRYFNLILQKSLENKIYLNIDKLSEYGYTPLLLLLSQSKSYKDTYKFRRLLNLHLQGKISINFSARSNSGDDVLSLLIQYTRDHKSRGVEIFDELIKYHLQGKLHLNLNSGETLQAIVKYTGVTVRYILTKLVDLRTKGLITLNFDSINKDKDTPLMKINSSSRVLLEAYRKGKIKLNLNHKNKDGESVLHKAMEQEYTFDILKNLVEIHEEGEVLDFQAEDNKGRNILMHGMTKKPHFTGRQYSTEKSIPYLLDLHKKGRLIFDLKKQDKEGKDLCQLAKEYKRKSFISVVCDQVN